jgi:hypothetical protein
MPDAVRRAAAGAHDEEGDKDVFRPVAGSATASELLPTAVQTR